MQERRTAEGSVLATARIYWQCGHWEALARIDARAASDLAPEGRAELLGYLLQAALQLGRIEAARQYLDAMADLGEERRELLRALVSSGFNTLARGWLVVGEDARAERCVRRSVGVYPERGEETVLAGMRLFQQAADLGEARALGGLRSLRREDRRLFIDCGGHDGCSVVAFLLANPHYDCVTFEPNSEFRAYYEDLPTQLIPKAVYVHDGEIQFTIDPVDGDGSSIFSDKKIDFFGVVSNADCPVVSVPCVDLSAFVRDASEKYGTISLKLDVEGAEYDILERMIEQGTLALVDEIYCEFHGRKMGWPPPREEALIARISQTHTIRPWDARAYSVHGSKVARSKRLRRELVEVIRRNRKNFQPLADSFSGTGNAI